ncbi:MAG: PEP-CTERM sorting domain-containing protein [Candidatus Korobacteraceae bacterium]
MRIASLSLLILCLALATASAQTLFTSGAINGNLNAFFIDGPGGPFGQSISNGFVDTTSGSATTLNFGEWTLGGAPTTVQWAIGTSSFGGTLSGPTAVTSTFLGTNAFGYGIYNTQVAISGSLTAGNTYYLTLSGANDAGGSQFDGWDDNESPVASCYFENPNGSGGCPTTESEAFTISGGTTTTGGTTPEPSSIMLLGSGILGLAGVLRRKLSR